MAKLLYKPVAIICGLIAGRLARRVFAALWRLIDKSPPPKPDSQQAPLGKLVAAAALEGATQRATRAAVDRAGAATFHHLTGLWPGRAPEKAEEAA